MYAVSLPRSSHCSILLNFLTKIIYDFLILRICVAYFAKHVLNLNNITQEIRIIKLLTTYTSANFVPLWNISLSLCLTHVRTGTVHHSSAQGYLLSLAYTSTNRWNVRLYWLLYTVGFQVGGVWAECFKYFKWVVVWICRLKSARNFWPFWFVVVSYMNMIPSSHIICCDISRKKRTLFLDVLFMQNEHLCPKVVFLHLFETFTTP